MKRYLRLFLLAFLCLGPSACNHDELDLEREEEYDPDDFSERELELDH
jgi:hypothetical protein